MMMRVCYNFFMNISISNLFSSVTSFLTYLIPLLVIPLSALVYAFISIPFFVIWLVCRGRAGDYVDKVNNSDIYYKNIIRDLTRIGLILAPIAFVVILFLSVLGGGLGGSNYNPLVSALEIVGAVVGVYFLNVFLLHLIYKRKIKVLAVQI